MGFKSHAHLQGYQVKEIKRLFDEEAMSEATRLTAIHMARVARNNFRALTKSSGSGQTLRDIRAMKGKYDETTWLYGVLGGTNPAGGSDAWLQSTGARAQFFEYGRSAPGKGRNRAAGRKKGQAVKHRAQPPRPFMRPTIAEGQRKLFGTSSKTVTRLCNKIKRGRIPKTILKTIA